jgi:hypothetical protein
MSKGNEIVHFRCPPELLADIQRAIASANNHRRDEPYTLSSWLTDCVRDRLAKLSHAKMSRLRRSKANRSKAHLVGVKELPAKG